MPIISVTRRAMRPSALNRLACAYLHQQKTATPKGELFVSSAFPDNFDDPEFIAETGKEKKSEENTRKPTEKAAGSTTDAAPKAKHDNTSTAEQEPRLDDM